MSSAVLAILCAASLHAQSAVRRPATLDALYQYPGYFHLQNVLLRGEFVERGTELVLRADARDIGLLNPAKAARGAVEVRAQLIDVGRLEPDDPRLGDYADRREQSQPWPGPGNELLLHITDVDEAPRAETPNVRTVALEPWKFEGQTVTLTGAFRGRNLLGDLPDAPRKSEHDFVLGSGEGAVWVTGLRPRGRGFNLDVDRRMDTSRWLEVTGVVERHRGMVTIAATGIALAPEPPPVTAPRDTTEAPSAPAPPTEVVFNSPTLDETDVERDATVRVQFSRGLREASLEGRIRASYLGAPAEAAPIELDATYDGATRSVQIRFAEPLEPFRTVRIELLEGITAFDGGPFAPWTLTFSVGR
jgi:hypothetical protein